MNTNNAPANYWQGRYLFPLIILERTPKVWINLRYAVNPKATFVPLHYASVFAGFSALKIGVTVRSV